METEVPIIERQEVLELYKKMTETRIRIQTKNVIINSPETFSR